MTRTLLASGILASLLYFVADVAGSLAWPAYSHMAQGVSELMAVGAPSRPPVLALMTVRTLLLFAFVGGIWRSAEGTFALRVAAILLLAEAVVGQVTGAFFPVPQRGAEGDANAHIVGTAAESILILLAMAFAAAAFGRRFRVYSVATILVLIAFGALTGLQAPRIEAGLRTPWLGVTERVNIYTYLIWMAALAIVLLRRGRGDFVNTPVRP